MHTYSYSSSRNDGCGPTVFILIIVILFVFWTMGSISAMISADDALARFEELAETDNVQILRHSNLTPIIGNAYDVTFELLVDGSHTSGRCTSDFLSPMICRIYSPDQSDQ